MIKKSWRITYYIFILSIIANSSIILSCNNIRVQFNLDQKHILSSDSVLIDSIPNHDPIIIIGNDNLDEFCSGNDTYGNETHPHIIRDYNIDANFGGSAIRLENINRTLIIENCTFWGALGGFDYAGIYLINCYNITIRNCTMINNYYGIFIYSSHNNTISINQILFNSYMGIYSFSSNNNSIFDNFICNNSDVGLYLYTSENNTISNNYFELNYIGIYTELSKEIRIKNNTINNNTFSGITLSYSSFNILEYNNLTNSGNTGIALSSSYNNSLISNTLKDSLQFDVYLIGSHNNTIVDTICYQSGFYIDGSFDNMIDQTNLVNNKPVFYIEDEEGITIEPNLEVSQYIMVSCKDLVLKDLQVSNVSVGFALHYCSNITGSNLTAYENLYSGLLGIGLNNITIEGSNFTSNNQFGIIIFGSNDTIFKDCNFSSNKFWAQVYISVINITVVYNNVSMNQNGIIFWDYQDINILNNTINSNFEQGLYFNWGSYFNISFNEVSFNLYGISFIGSNHSIIMQNNCSFNQYYGINSIWNNFNNKIDSNILSYNQISGVYSSYSENNNWSFNEVNFNQKYGFFFDYKCKNDLIYGNNISSNEYVAIYSLNSEKIIIENNSIKFNKFIGIYMYRTQKSTISTNLLENNTLISIYNYRSHQNKIENNIVSGNEIGLMIRECEGNIISGNNISKNNKGLLLLGSNENKIISNSFNNFVYNLDNGGEMNEFYHNLGISDSISLSVFSIIVALICLISIALFIGIKKREELTKIIKKLKILNGKSRS